MLLLFAELYSSRCSVFTEIIDFHRYLRDGRATTKSDVYAFGVVLFELISGKEAIIRTEGVIVNNAERRSLASVVSPSSQKIAAVAPNNYSFDLVVEFVFWH